MFSLSFILFIVASCLLAVWRKSNALRFAFAVFYFLYTLAFAVYFGIDYFTGAGITPGAIYTLGYGLGGAGFGDYISDTCLLLAVLGVVFALFYLMEVRGLSRRLTAVCPERLCLLSGIVLLAASITANPILPDLMRLGGGRGQLPVSNSHSSGLMSAKSSDPFSFSSAYRQPGISARSSAPKNIVYVYGESLERTYLDEKIFPGLMPGIKRLESVGISFINIEQLPEAWWTMGGMVASQCGVPLVLYSDRSIVSGQNNYCLGDLLKQEGYNLAYIGGARLSFSGKGLFYRSHGFDDVSGFDELKSTEVVAGSGEAWGIPDDVMFNLAYDKFDRLSKSGRPFGLFMITLDTHMPGHVAKACGDMKYGDGGNNILNAAHCDDKLITDFIDRIRSSPAGADTAVVLASDHISMRNSASALLQKGDRKNLVLMLPPGRTSPVRIDRPGTTFDTGATILDLLGYKGSLGLGRDLLSEDSIVYSASKVSGGFPAQWLEAARDVWTLPETRDIRVNSMDASALLNGRRISLPLLIQSERGRPDKYFVNSFEEKHLLAYLAQFPPESSYIYIDQCSNTSALTGADAVNTGWCLVAGKLGASQVFSQSVSKNKYFGPGMVDRLHALPLDKPAYRENMLKILGRELHPGIRAMLDMVPDGSAVFVSNPAQSSYAGPSYFARRYAQLNGKTVSVYCFDDDVAGRKFYALDYELRNLRYAGYVLEAVPAGGNVMLVTKIRRPAKASGR
jgi:phosphoglycerol transferase